MHCSLIYNDMSSTFHLKVIAADLVDQDAIKFEDSPIKKRIFAVVCKNENAISGGMVNYNDNDNYGSDPPSEF
jgi:hypothetical protein